MIKKEKDKMVENTNNVKGVLDVTVEKMKAVADADTIIGSRIELSEGVCAIPIFKVTYGFAAGGSDFVSKNIGNRPNLFGGGGGGGMTVTPIAFLVSKGSDVELLNINAAVATEGPASAISLVPEMFDKIVSLYKENKAQKEKKKADQENG